VGQEEGGEAAGGEGSILGALELAEADDQLALFTGGLEGEATAW
jgi:hypothetical protein